MAITRLKTAINDCYTVNDCYKVKDFVKQNSPRCERLGLFL